MDTTITEQSNPAKREVTIGTAEANVYAMIFILPIILVFAVPYLLIWKDSFELSKETLKSALPYFWWVLPITLIGVVVHELIHGVSWAFYAKSGYKSIRYGVIWKYLTPYCHCKEPLKMTHYKIGAVMPAIILGFLPSIAGIISGSLVLLLFGMFFSIAAGGDFLMLWLLRKENSQSFVQDHPEKIGCYVFENKEN